MLYIKSLAKCQMDAAAKLKQILDAASSLRKDDKIGLTFLLSDSPEIGRHVIREIAISTALTDENGLFQQFLLQLHLTNPCLENSFIEACAIVQNYRVGRVLGFSKLEMLSERFSGKINPTKKSLYMLAESLTDKQTQDLVSKFDGINSRYNYLEEAFFDWQLRGVISGTEFDSSSLERLERCLNDGNGNERQPGQALQRNQEFYAILDANNLGYCIIINNSSFSQNSDLKKLMPAEKLEPRKGSDRDIDCLKQTFSALKFTVKIHENVKYGKLKELLSSYSSSIPENHSFVVLIFMSHGREDVVYTSDSVPVSVEALEMAFQRNNCPQMTGKPKILVIQACQGDSVQTVTLDCPKPPTNLSTLSLGPERGDALIAWSTVKGYASFRDRNNGSWFIQEFCRELKENASTRDLLDIVTRVNNELRSKAHLGMFMVPSLSTSLCKKIKFA